MSSWSEERRADKAADAAERRRDEEHRATLRRDERRKDRDETRVDKAQRRRDRHQRRQARAARRERTLRPENVYRRGTLFLVALSALASLPAQILHFVSISWVLLPIGPALEGAAWVMAAGVAYADERKLGPWVRWLLRGLSLGAASFAAVINYRYGMSLQGEGGLTAEQAAMVGTGLAAVTLGGPLFFEVRQWVITLSAKARDPKKLAEEKARARHERDRRRAFRDVAKRAKQLRLAAPYGTLTAEDAFARAWRDTEGAPVGITAKVFAERLKAEAAVSDVLAEADRTPEQIAVELLLADLFGPPHGDGGSAGGTFEGAPSGGPRGGPPKGRTALGGKGKRSVRATAAEGPVKPLSEAELARVRALAEALGGTGKLSARNIREAVGCRTEHAIRLRDAIRAEQTEKEAGK